MLYDDSDPDGEFEALPILFLHGAVQTRAIWDQQVEALLGQRRVVVPDLRGHGETPLGDTPMSVGLLAEDCLALIERLGLSRIVVCGVSLGGMIALDLAARAPDRVAALVLANTPRALSNNRWIRGLVDFANPHRLLPLAFLLLGRERAAKAGLACARLTVGPHWVGETARRHFIRGFVMMREDAIVATYRSIVESRPVDLDRILCPCLVIDGTDDALSIREQAAKIDAETDGAALAVMKAGHVANLDDAPAFNAILLRFLERLEKPAAAH